MKAEHFQLGMIEEKQGVVLCKIPYLMGIKRSDADWEAAQMRIIWFSSEKPFALERLPVD